MRNHGLRQMTRLLREQDGQDAIEYALAAGLIGIGAIFCLKGLSSTFRFLFALGASFISWIT